jgi:Methyltransferase domain
VLTLWLAEKDLKVTRSDILPEAITMARSLAEQRRAEIEFITADLFSYAPERPFDLVYDSGRLHLLVGGNTTLYKTGSSVTSCRESRSRLSIGGNAMPSTGARSGLAGAPRRRSRKCSRLSSSLSRRT